MKIKNNVLIITSLTEDGDGVTAICKQFAKYHQNYNVVVINEKQYGAERAAKRHDKNRERLMQSMPTLYRRMRTAKLAFSLKRSQSDKRRAISDKLRGETRKIYNAILRFSPDVILVTTPHILQEVISAKRKAHFKNPVVGLAHGYTFDKVFYNMSADAYIVENADMKNQLTAMGYSSNRVYVLGFPIEEELPDVDFLIKKKEHLGLNLNPTVYLSGGNIGSKELMPVFELLLDQGTMINLIVNCGKNDNLYGEMLHETERRGAENVRVYLNTDEEVEDTLAAADCLVTIYDSVLIYRAFLLGIPVIAYAPDNSAEKRDLAYLKEKGLIYFAEDYNAVIIGMCDIIQNNLGKKLSEAASVRTRPNSLEEICVTLTSFGGGKK